MVFKSFKSLKISNSRGITLVEVIVAIFIISTFSVILLSDFPKIKQSFALSRAAYKLAQDFRHVQDMALSGVQTTDENNKPAKGYGIYINLSTHGNKKYIIYADFNGNQAYDSGEEVKTIDFNSSEAGVIIKQLNNTSSQSVSVNFRPPNPDINISTLKGGNTRIEIVFALENNLSATKSVFVNKLGLIETK